MNENPGRRSQTLFLPGFLLVNAKPPAEPVEVKAQAMKKKSSESHHVNMIDHYEQERQNSIVLPHSKCVVICNSALFISRVISSMSRTRIKLDEADIRSFHRAMISRVSCQASRQAGKTPLPCVRQMGIRQFITLYLNRK